MPRIGITAYDLLVSCPGDVVDYVDIIRECVDNFNRTIGVANDSEIVVKHWSTDSYPESGDKPQELLNKQFVRDCDAAVALFWTKFGTKTDKYGSGTEEEIEEMLSSDKQVFMYFLDAPTNPSTLDMGQYSKVQDFRKKYASRGIYSVIKDKNEFRTQFTNHLTMYFLPLVSGKQVPFENKATPKIAIKNETLDELPQVVATTSHFVECKLLDDKKTLCVEKLKSLQNNLLPQRTSNEIVQIDEPPTNDAVKSIMNMQAFSLSDLHDADISDEMKRVITDFAIENDITIEPSFWNVGNLKQGTSIIPAQLGGGATLSGSQEEQQRYKRLKKLYWDIEEYMEYKAFFAFMDEKYYVSLVVSNDGNTFDEDIDIKITVDKGFIVHPDDIILPGINIIEEILKIGFIEFAFTIKSNDIIAQYPEYSVTMPKYRVPVPFGKSAHEEYEEQKENFEDEINRIFCYNYYDKKDKDIISFHISYLKHNTTIAFPSVLLFKKTPTEIEYEITSKHLPDITKGKISVIKDK